MKVYGRVYLRDGFWAVDAEPHVRVRLKRLFGRIAQTASGVLTVKAIPETSRDLVWFIDRYPMNMEPADKAELLRLAQSYDDARAATFRVLTGEGLKAPPGMAIPPRNYQLQAAELAYLRGGLLVADVVGLGKTCTAITLLAREGALPALFVCQPHVQRQIEAEVNRFMPSASTHIVKTSLPYILTDKSGLDPDVVIITYHKLSTWSDYFQGMFQTIVFDECQELRRTASNKYVAAQLLAGSVKYRMGLSATPIYNYGEEFWNVINVIRPDALGMRDEFLREWCVPGPKQSKIKDTGAFGTYLRDEGLMVRRTRTEVGRELPAVNRVTVDVEHDHSWLDAIESPAAELAKIIVGGSKGFDILKASQELSAKVRQATGIAKAPYVAAFVRLLLESEGQPIILFGWHREVYGIWESIFKDLNPAWYTGTETPAKKDAEAKRFIRGETPLMIMSLRSGTGLDGLQKKCSTVVFGELDWSPGVLEQDIGRVHRDGQGNPVFAYYVVAGDGADPIMVDVLGLKKEQITGVIDPDAPVSVLDSVDPEYIKKLAKRYLNRSR